MLPREVLPLRKWEDRARLAAHITRTFFSISPRTLETWSVRTITMNKRTLLNTDEALNHARRLLKAAEKEAVRGGNWAPYRGRRSRSMVGAVETDEAAAA